MEKKYLSRDKLVGKQVIDSTAMIIGNVKDISYNLEAKEIGLTITTKSGEEITVPSSNVSNVGDIILLDKNIDSAKVLLTVPSPPINPPSPPTLTPQPIKEISTKTPGLCSSCHFQNDTTSRFCIKCGTKL